MELDVKRLLSISPWPSVWSQGEGGGAPSEAYAIEAMVMAGFKTTHLSPHAAGLPHIEEKGDVRFVRISNPFVRFRPLLKTGIAFIYRLPAISAWSVLVSDWLRKSGERFDLVVGHSSETIYALRRVASILKVPSICRLYGISAPIDQLRRGLRRELYFDILSLFRNPPDYLVITDDGTCGDEAARIFGLEPERYWFPLNGYDPNLLSLDCEESSSPYVLTATRLVDWKRVDRVIRIAAFLKPRLPQLRFLILGDGPERPSLERLIRDLDLSSNVRLLGRVPRSRMYEFLRGASVVLSTQDLTNLGNTVLEALVLGKAVVVLNSGCTAKLIFHEQTGLIYPPDDLEGAAGGVERLIRDKGFRRALGSRARKFARKMLKPWPERIKAEVKIYRRFNPISSS